MAGAFELVQESFVADSEGRRCLFAIPLRLLECFENGFSFRNLNQRYEHYLTDARIFRLSMPDQFRLQDNRTQLMASCQSFIRMYRPHKSREETILFPALRTLLTPRQVEALGDKMEADEHKVLGEKGFEKSVDKVASIEKALGIYDLAQFTPEA